MAAAMGDSIQRYPLLRLLFSYLCGLGLADVLYPHVDSLCQLGLWGVLLSLLLLFMSIGRRGLSYGIVAAALFLMLGVWSYAWTRGKTEYAWPPGELVYEARVATEPRARQRSVLCEVEVMAVRDSSEWRRIERKVMAYLEPSDEADALLPGDVLCFRGNVRKPYNFTDSLAFDYARYVTMQGASGTIYLSRGQWTKVGVSRLSLRERMLRLRHRLKEKYIEASFDGDVLGILSAMTLGDKRGLNPEIREVYGNAGTAHVLALSGLHVGVVYGIFALVFRSLLRKRRLRWLCELLPIVILWLFALLVGMSVSVVRAVAMCTLYVFARWLSDGSSSPLHTLSLTALLMLLVRPLWLFDVGFQLSFMAMAAILWVEPYLEELFRRHSLHPIWGYLVGLLCMSLAAQLGTFPLVLYHFGTFPCYFLLTNVFVVPSLSILLLLSLVWWVLLLIDAPWALSVGLLLQHLVECMNKVLEHIGTWPGAVLHVEGYGLGTMLFTYLFLLFAGLFAIKKWKRGALLALASLLGLLLSLLLKP